MRTAQAPSRSQLKAGFRACNQWLSGLQPMASGTLKALLSGAKSTASITQSQPFRPPEAQLSSRNRSLSARTNDFADELFAEKLSRVEYGCRI